MIYLKTDKESFINGSYGKEFFNIPYDAKKFESLQELEAKVNKELEKEDPSKEEIDLLLEACKDVVTIKEVSVMVEGTTNFMYDPTKECYCITAFDFATNKQYVEPLTKMATEYCKNVIGMGLSIQPVINCFMRLMSTNFYTSARLDKLVTRLKAEFINYDSVEKLVKEGIAYDVAVRRCTYPDVQLTSEGMLSLYKVVEEVKTKYVRLEDGSKGTADMYVLESKLNPITGKEEGHVNYPVNLEDRVFRPAIHSDGIDFYCGDTLGYIYKVGETHSIPKWSDMDMDESRSHSGTGLYCGSLSYVQAYNNSSREVMRCFVCPSNIGKFTDEGRGEITCKEMFIFDSVTIDTSVVKGLYHSSRYASTVIEAIAVAFCKKKAYDALKEEIENK